MIGAALVDTDVLSFLFKGDTRAAKYRAHLTGTLLVVSFMSIAELERWALQRNWGEVRRASMEERLRQFVLPPVDRELCLKWAEVTDAARRSGFSVTCADAWIAATALTYNIPLITHNASDFRGIEHLTIVSEQDEPL
jgi:tRNA(fMet)-specific endonuclease VapC